MSLSQTSDTPTIEDLSMNRQTTEDGEGQPTFKPISPDESVPSSPQKVGKESRGMKRRRSTEAVLGEGIPNTGEAPEREAKRPKPASKDLCSFLWSMENSAHELDRLHLAVEALRTTHIKSMAGFVQLAEGNGLEGSNSYAPGESDRQMIEEFKGFFVDYEIYWQM